ncbi:MAG: nucleotidyltransferase family protein [Clostridiaceae bacterium]|nr:nucleotidyltransferase family protein [Clostridiaceae bacterium]MBW4859679.1 nucleotidyltransferase family protein [Clostridiaceae bacterium]MBW4868800.1 nucleotidyltransferase family protein [Clostridiaceae bacterium]
MKKNINNLFVLRKCKLLDALKKLNDTAKGILLVVDEKNRLVGTITDGDIRRALLKEIPLYESIDKVVHFDPIYINSTATRDEIKDLFIRKAVKQIPVVDNDGVVLDLISINDILIPEGKENPVVIMAGGLGTRLKDLTKEIPKPMLKVGEEPILYHIINNFKQYGYNRMLISVNYKAEIIENYFQDGQAYNVKIDYIREKKRLGTAGGIRLAKDYLNSPFFVTNGDIFTNLNVENMMKFHLENKFDMTLGVRDYSLQIPYGVIETEDKIIKDIKEKPEVNCLINAGVYCMNPEVINYIPENKYFEITDLMNVCIKEGLKLGSYNIKEYWMDIGRVEDYNKVNRDLNNNNINIGDKND